jgi:hypothetical protein
VPLALHVIPGLVPGIQRAAGAEASGTVDPGDKHRDDSYAFSLKRWILPVCVLGRAGTNLMERGYLYGAIVALT